MPGDLTARDIHALVRGLAGRVHDSLGIVLTLGVYASADGSPVLAAMRRRIGELAEGIPGILELHGFLGDEAARTALFDIVVDFAADAPGVRDGLLAALRDEYPGWSFDIVLDTDAAGHRRPLEPPDRG